LVEAADDNPGGQEYHLAEVDLPRDGVPGRLLPAEYCILG